VGLDIEGVPMTATQNKASQQAMDLAEDARQTEWQYPSFVAELFKGKVRWDLLSPYPVQSEEDKKIGDAILVKIEDVLTQHIDPDWIDRNESLPIDARQALVDAGLFGMKIDQKYGGLGLSVYNYARAMELIGSWCGSTAVWLSAHQSIGVPQPLKLFGTTAQKEKYLPRLAKGAISAFALTEPEVGSDPARMKTTASPSEDGEFYYINGEKLYITNGPDAELLVVMALTPPIMVDGKEKQQITAFIVETDTPGFEVVRRLSFMGIRGIANGQLKFSQVKVPKENIIGGVGQGLKIALTTLNTGRLTIPAVSTGVGKLCMRWATKWANKRVQWGQPIGRHQEVGKKLAEMTANTFALESMSYVTAAAADHKNADIRLEAAMAKYFGSEVSWQIADETLQIRGGRGFEAAHSLKSRGEDPVPIERVLRDLRINRIIEGTSEIMRLFIAREAMDVHLRFIFPLLNPKLSIGKKLKTALSAARFYLLWYPTTWFPALPLPARHLSAKNQQHLHFIQSASKRLARQLFHAMASYQTRLEKEQLLLGYFVNIGTELFAMACSLARAEHLLATDPKAKQVQEVADLFCRLSRRKIESQFRAIHSNDHHEVNVVSAHVLDGRYDWMIKGVMP